MTLICESAPAKVNLTLHVLGRRPDGYHEIQSLVAFASQTCDVVTLDTSKPTGVTMSGPFAASIAGANLVETTLRLIEKRAPQLQLGAVHLEKNLPVAAGIGGGSSDAAAVMRAVRRVNDEACGDLDWPRLGLKLGADVPVCLYARLAWMAGIGEIVQPITRADDASIPAVIVNPLVSVPADKTAQIFRALGAAPLASGHASCVPVARPHSVRDVISLACTGVNTLEAPARKVVPAVEDVLAALSACAGNMLTRMSGAGPTCYALFSSQSAAQSAAEAIFAAHPRWWVRATALH